MYNEQEMYSEQAIQAINISRDKHYEPQSLKNYKANRAKALAEQTNNQSLDSDVLLWLGNQDSDTKRHINEMIRHVMAMKTA